MSISLAIIQMLFFVSSFHLIGCVLAWFRLGFILFEGH